MNGVDLANKLMRELTDDDRLIRSSEVGIALTALTMVVARIITTTADYPPDEVSNRITDFLGALLDNCNDYMIEEAYRKQLN